MPVSITLLRGDGVVDYANAETEHLTGYKHDKIVGRAFWLEAAHPEDAGKLAHAFRRSERGEAHLVAFRYLSNRPGPRLAEMHLFPARGNASWRVEAITFDVTERHEVEEALFQSEALYKIFLEQSPIGMLHVDTAGMVTFENHQFRQIVGEEPDEAWIGRSVYEIDGLDPQLEPGIRRMLAEGASLSDEMVRFRRPDPGGHHRLKFHGSPIRHPDSGIIGGVLMVEDCTEEVRRREELELHSRYDASESALRKAALNDSTEEEFLREAARLLGETSAADRAVLLMSNGVGDCCTDLARWQRGSVQTPGSLVIMPDEFPDLVRMEPGSSLHLRDHAGEAVNHVLLRKTGVIEAIWMPFWDDARLGGYVALERFATDAERGPDRLDGPRIWTDTERSQIEQLVRLFETLWTWRLAGNRYRHITGAIDDCLFNFTYDEDGERRYLFLTPQIANLAGYPPARLIARGDDHVSWSDAVVHADDRAALDRHDDAIRQGRESNLTYRIRHVDGSTRWLREQATPEPDVMGDVTVSGILTDVTEQKVAEKVLTESMLEAESANRLKSALIATMSHEIRTPMGAVNGFAELLARELEEHADRSADTLPPQVSEFLEAIRENSQKLLTLVNDLFDLSNLEEGAVDIHLADVSLNDVVLNGARKVADVLSRKHVEMHVDLSAADPIVVADARRLEQIIDNLLSNAVKFTESGSVWIHTRLDDDGQAILEIRDTGVGIAADYVGRLFEPFAQEDSRLNRQFGGSGLGLSLTKRLLDLMNGEIAVESRKGEGSTFVVMLPTSNHAPDAS